MTDASNQESLKEDETARLCMPGIPSRYASPPDFGGFAHLAQLLPMF